MSIIARIDQQVNLSTNFTDAKGNPVTELGSVPAWSVSDAGIATVTASADGLSAVVKPVGALGTVQVNMTVDADPDEDTEEIVGTVDIEFKSGKATFVTLNGTAGDLLTPSTGLPGVPDNALPGSQPGIDNTLPGGRPGRPDNSLPSGRPDRPDNSLPGGLPTRPDNSLPGAPARPDTGLPPGAERPDAGLPVEPGRPSQGLPGTPDNTLPGGGGGGRPDAGLPGSQPGVGNELPNAPVRPGNALPETPSTKPGSPAGHPDAGLPPGATPKKKKW
jgi:hypothetical protein